MALTLEEISLCRELLADYRAKLVQDTAEVVTVENGRMTRYWDGISEPYQDICKEFLKTIVSSINEDVVEITGVTTPYAIAGEYYDTGEFENDYATRKEYDSDYWIKVDLTALNYKWIIVNEWDDVLYESQSQLVEPVAINDASWTPVEVSFENDSTRDNMIVPLVAIVDEFGVVTFTQSGAITSTIVAPAVGVYSTVVDPLADAMIRGGTWRAGPILIEKQQNGTWTVYQTLYLLNEPHLYILIESRKTSNTTESTRLYPRVPEADVSALVDSLATLDSYAVIDVKSRETQNPGIFDVYTEMVEVSTGTSYIVSGKQSTTYTYQESRLYQYVKESNVSAIINLGATLGTNQIRIGSNMRKSRYEGIYDVEVVTLTLKAGVTEQIGGSNVGFFKSRAAYVVRHVKDGEIAAVVTAYLASPGIESVRASSSGQEGYSHVYYTQVELPDSTTETDISLETSEGGWKPEEYVRVNAYRKYIDFPPDQEGNVTYDYQLYEMSLPISHSINALVRKVTATSIKTYTWIKTGTVSGSGSASGNDKTSSFILDGGKQRKLPNGVWMLETANIIKTQWGTTI